MAKGFSRRLFGFACAAFVSLAGQLVNEPQFLIANCP
jgi:hypothetical protein